MSEFLYNNEISGLSHYYWWMGQIVDDIYWKDNINPKIHKAEDVLGWGYRYKVRIFGRDTETKDTPDERLEMAEVLLPVTAGSGHGGSQQTPNLKQGNYVFGFYKDGIDSTEPIIFGVLANNSQTQLFGGDPQKAFIPRSGYKGKSGDKKVSKKDMYIKGSGPGNKILIESAAGVNQTSVSTVSDQPYDGKKSSPVSTPVSCAGQSSEMKGISLTINNLLKDIARIKSQSQKFSSAATDINATISNLTSAAAGVISGFVKSIFDKIRGYVIEKVMNAISDVAPALFPNQRPNLQSQAEIATDSLSCIFNQIMGRLENLVRRILNELINNFVIAPLCAIENLISALISDGLAPVLEAIDSILSQISNVIGISISIVGKFTEILDFVTGIFKFFLCDEVLSCPEVEEWSFWDGVTNFTGDIQKLPSSLAIEASRGVSDFLDNPSSVQCSPSPKPCGPPTISFLDSSGGGAFGNLIVSTTGSILGIDLISFGGQYSSTVSAVINDVCNIGGGAVLLPIVNDSSPEPQTDSLPETEISSSTITRVGIGTDEDDGIGTDQTRQISDPSDGDQGGGRGEISKVVVIDSGSGYLNSFNGSTGGFGRVFSRKCDTIVFSSSGGWNVYSPDSVINLVAGDEIYLPPRARIDLYSDGEISQTLIGEGQTTKLIVNINSSIVAPNCVPDNTIVPSNISNSGISTIINVENNFTTGVSTSSTGVIRDSTYPVVLSIGDLYIKDSGINYQENDKISIIPDNGAVLEPIFGSFGRLEKVKVIKPGIGFTEFPNISIESETGVNADIIPIFDVIRIGDLNEESDLVPVGTPIITVVDCVGRG
jgi:hypothetical protein